MEKRRLRESDRKDTLDLGIIDFGDYDTQNGEFKKGFIPPGYEDKNNGKKGLEKKLEKWKVSVETEIKFDLENLTLSIKTSGKKELGKDGHFGYQYPLYFPAFPLFQFRFGFKFEIYIKFIFGIELLLDASKKDGLSADFRVLLDFSVGVKVNVRAEIGLFSGFLNVYGGVEGTIFDARAGIRFFLSVKDGYVDLYIVRELYFLTTQTFKFKGRLEPIHLKEIRKEEENEEESKKEKENEEEEKEEDEKKEELKLKIIFNEEELKKNAKKEINFLRKKIKAKK